MELIKDNKNQKLIILLLKGILINDIILILSDYIRDVTIYNVIKDPTRTYINIKNKKFAINQNHINFQLGYYSDIANYFNITSCIYPLLIGLYTDFINLFLKCNKQDIIQNFSVPYENDDRNYISIKCCDLIKKLKHNDYCPPHIKGLYVNSINNTDLIKIIKKKNLVNFFY